MSQVKLIIREGYGGEQRPYKAETGKVIDLNVRVPDTHDIVALVRTDFDVEDDGSRRTNDAINPVVRYERINDLIGKLLTLVDSMFSDSEQRKAAKDVFKQCVWDWYSGQTDPGVIDIWRKGKFPKTAAMQEKEHEEVFGKTEQ